MLKAILAEALAEPRSPIELEGARLIASSAGETAKSAVLIEPAKEIQF